MVSAQITLGGELDIASGAEVNAGFNDMRSWLDKRLDAKAAYKIRKPFSGTVNNALAGTNICYFPVSPPAGKLWHIKLVTTNVNDDHTTPSGNTSASVTTPSVPASGASVQNPNPFGVQTVINANGATITNVSVNGVTVGTGAGTYYVPEFGTISITYSVATPLWTWTQFPVSPGTVIAALYCGDPYSPTLTQNKIAGMVLPYSNQFGSDRLICKTTEYIFVVYYNVAAGSLLWINLEVDEMLTKHNEAMYI